MPRWSDNWGSSISEALRFLRTGSVAYTKDAYFSNIKSKRAGCVDSSDCAVGWRCSRGYCTQPSNSPGSTRNNSVNDQGCGGNNGSSSGGGGGLCGATTGGGGRRLIADNETADFYQSIRKSALARGDSVGIGITGDVVTVTVNGECVKTGCGRLGDASGKEDDCCGDVRCCRISGRTQSVRCGCGPCESDEDCDKFCSGYNAATGMGPAPGCDENKQCDECTDCKFFAFQGTKDLYRCEPKTSGSPCWCNNEDNTCRPCTYCTDGGGCLTDYSDETCFPKREPKPEPEEKECYINQFTELICAPVDAVPSAIDQCLDHPRLQNDVAYTETTGRDVSGDPAFNCIGCKFTVIIGDCEKPCDCNCDDDCGDCEICEATGECGPDPACYEVKGEFFHEMAWFNLATTTFLPCYSDGVGSEPTCSPETCTTEYVPAPILMGANAGRTGIDPEGLSVNRVDLGTGCTNYGLCGAPSSISRFDVEVVQPNGTVSNTRRLDDTSCGVGALSAFRQDIYTYGVTVGYGDTPSEACANARDSLAPLYPPISGPICGD